MRQNRNPSQPSVTPKLRLTHGATSAHLWWCLVLRCLDNILSSHGVINTHRLTPFALEPFRTVPPLPAGWKHLTLPGWGTLARTSWSRLRICDRVLNPTREASGQDVSSRDKKISIPRSQFYRQEGNTERGKNRELSRSDSAAEKVWVWGTLTLSFMFWPQWLQVS